MSYRTGPKIVTDGLVLCLDAADRNSYPLSGSTWYDLSGNGYNGTLTNGPSFNNSNGGNIVFDGTNDYVSVLNYSSLESLNTSEVTVEIFAKATGTGSYSPFILFRPDSINAYSYLTLGNFTGYWSNESLSWYSGGEILGFAYTNGHAYFQDSEIRQYVVTLKTNNYKLYANGNQLTLNNSFRNGSQATSMTTDLFSGGIYIADLDNNFNGNVYRASIYNKILSDQEIRQNYEATKGRFGL